MYMSFIERIKIAVCYLATAALESVWSSIGADKTGGGAQKFQGIRTLSALRSNYPDPASGASML